MLEFFRRSSARIENEMLACFSTFVSAKAPSWNTGEISQCSIPVEILDFAGQGIPLRFTNWVGQERYEPLDNPFLGNSQWLDWRTISVLQSDFIWMDSGEVVPSISPFNFAELNQQREAIQRKLEWCESVTVVFDALDAETFDQIQDGGWTYHLENAISVIFPFAASGNVAPFVSMFRAGDLVYTSFIDCVGSWFEKTGSLLIKCKRLGTLILTWLRSRRGLSNIGIFVTERSWYLHHSAHPPDGADKAVEGCFAAAMRRVCFWPLPA
jgi:hypothetical protein